MPAKKTKKKAVKKKVVSKPKTMVLDPQVDTNKAEIPRMTAGFIVLLVFFGISFISFLISLVSGKAAVGGIIFGVAYGPVPGLLLGIISALILVALSYGIIRRIGWTRELALGWYGLMSLQTVVSLITYAFNKDAIISVLMSSIPQESLPAGVSASTMAAQLGLWYVVGGVISLLIFLFIMLFFYKKKNYFVN